MKLSRAHFISYLKNKKRNRRTCLASTFKPNLPINGNNVVVTLLSTYARWRAISLTDLSTKCFVQRHGFKGNILSREISVNRIRLLRAFDTTNGKTTSPMSNDTKHLWKWKDCRWILIDIFEWYVTSENDLNEWMCTK